MYLNFDSIRNNHEEEIIYHGDKDKLNSLNHSSIIKDIKDVEGKIYLTKVNNILSLSFNIDVNLIIESAYTLKDIPYFIKIDETLYYTNDESLESEEVFLTKNKLDLEEIIYSLIITLVPLNAHGGNETLPSSDEFKVYSEEELEKENSSDKESPFDILKDLDL